MLDEKAITNAQESLRRLAEEFTKVFIRLANGLMEIWGEIEEFAKEYFVHEKECELRRQHYRLDFKRPKIQHQVLDRKPRNLIKKII